MPDPRVALAVFCEDIRQEVAGKHSFMGVFSGPVTLQGPPPASLLRMAVAVWLICDVGDLPRRCTVSVRLAGTGMGQGGRGEQVELTRYDVTPDGASVLPDDEARKQIVFSACVLPPFEVPGPDTLEVWVGAADGEEYRAGRLPFLFAPAVLPGGEGVG